MIKKTNENLQKTVEVLVKIYERRMKSKWTKKKWSFKKK